MAATRTVSRASAEPPTRREIEEGLAYLHARVGATAARALESASFVYALLEILVERGLLTVAEIDARKKQVAPRLLKRFESQDAGVAVQQSAHDKYHPPQEVTIDCASRLPLRMVLPSRSHTRTSRPVPVSAT